MRRFLLASLTGWSAVLVVGIETALPYLIRTNLIRSNLMQSNPIRGRVLSRSQVKTSEHEAPVANLHERMWPHYWVGYCLAALVLAHTWFVMGPAMAKSDSLGIWSATVAFFLLPLQIGLGLFLRDVATHGRSRRRAQRLHFWTMIAFIALVVFHVARNAR